MKSYILIYSPIIEYRYAHRILSETKAIENWIAPFPNSAILISNLTLGELSAIIHNYFGDAWFVLTEANKDSTNGWLPQEFWSYVNAPHTVWSKNIFPPQAPQLPPVHPPPKW